MERSIDPAAGASLVVGELRTEYLSNPIGLDEPRPRFSWKLKAAAGRESERGLTQSAYQIRVSRDHATIDNGDLWDSGKVQSGETSFIEYAGPALRSGERVWWAVRVWDQNDQPSVMSSPAFWEMGLLERADWQAQWISAHAVGGPQTEAAVPFFRKAFGLASRKAVVSARLYATALGVYEFHINGKKVGDDVFTPGWTDYHQRVQYQAYDVTNLLNGDGENVIGAILGDGWYCGYTGNIRRRQYYGDRPKLLGQLHLRFSDGSHQIIGTDGSWTTATGPILASDMFMGESYDARREMPGWDAPGFTPDTRWTPVEIFEDTGAAIVGMTGPTVRAVKELRPIKIHKRGAGRDTIYVVDLGQNMVGHVRLRVKGKAGATIRMQFVEVLDDKGNPYTANLRIAKQTDFYTLRGDVSGETFEPRFTFHGFRYVAVHGYPGELTTDAITGVVLHSDMAETGTFECSDPLVNQLQHNIQWGQRGNFLDVPTDCPQRDERLGWTGDAQVFVRTAAFNFDVSGFFAKWTHDLRDAQTKRGSYPEIVPDNGRTPGEALLPFSGDGGPAWADAGIICPWTMYLCYGDRRLLERHYASMVRFVEYMEKEAEPFGMIRSHPDWKGWHGFGDWLSQDGGKDRFGSTTKDLIGTAFLAHDARLLASIADVLGKPDDANRFTQLSELAAAAFCRRFVTPDGLIIGHTQTAYVLALHFDLLPEALRGPAVESLVRNIRDNGNKLSTGFVGSPYLNHVLTRAGRLDVAYDLLMQQQWPSWLYAVTHGATTIWERWDGWTHDRGFQDPGMNSFNHYAYGAIGDWLYQVVAGIEIDRAKPGYRHVNLHPHPQINGPLTHAAATLDTIHGRIESGWRLDGGALHYNVTLPPNVTATMTIDATADGAMESSTALDKARGVEIVETSVKRVVTQLVSGQYHFVFHLPVT